MKQRILMSITAIAALALLISACQPALDVAKEAANKDVIRRLVRGGKNRGNPAALQDIFSPEYQHHFNFPGAELPPGLAGAAGVEYHLLVHFRLLLFVLSFSQFAIFFTGLQMGEPREYWTNNKEWDADFNSLISNLQSLTANLKQMSLL